MKIMGAVKVGTAARGNHGGTQADRPQQPATTPCHRAGLDRKKMKDIETGNAPDAAREARAPEAGEPHLVAAL